MGKKKAAKKKSKAARSTEIVVVVDRSGSMESIRTDAMGGFNSFLAEQKKEPGKATMSVVLFDHEYEMLHSAVGIQDVPPLTESTYVPRGTTALYDAVGRAVNDVKARIDAAKKKDKPDGVVVAILTDGYENASKDFNQSSVFKMIEERTKAGWSFLFLAAHKDAFEVGRGLGIAANLTAMTKATGVGTRSAYGGVSNLVSNYRSGGQGAVRNCNLQSVVDDADDSSE